LNLYLNNSGYMLPITLEFITCRHSQEVVSPCVPRSYVSSLNVLNEWRWRVISSGI
jgi:hypothetical protein